MKVLFVCTGNMCRSPMLEYLFKHYLMTHGIENIEVDSAGTMHHEKPMSRGTVVVLSSRNIAYDINKTSKFCSEDLINSSDFVFTMTASQAEYLNESYGNNNKIISLGELLGHEVDDPYGKGLYAYEMTYETFEVAVPKIWDYITKTGD